MQSDIDEKVSELVTKYAIAAHEAMTAKDLAIQKQREANQLARRLEFWLEKQKQKISGRKMKIKPRPKRKESKNG